MEILYQKALRSVRSGVMARVTHFAAFQLPRLSGKSDPESHVPILAFEDTDNIIADSKRLCKGTKP